jgi:prepilin-type N-terminal cleavage/methylation domain-containing protein
MRSARENDEGYTLIELLMVILIIGILTGISVPSIASQRTKARAAAMRTSLRDAGNAQESLAVDVGRYAPAGPAGLVVLEAQGFKPTDGVTIAVLDDSIANGGGYCLSAGATGLPTLYLAGSGPEGGRVSNVSCAP